MYSFDSRIRFSETDPTGHLSVVALINYLQDCAVFHSESVGSGWRQLQKRGLAWVIMTWQIHVDELPQLGDEIRVSTWAYGMSGHSAKRDVLIASPDGSRTFVRATSLWSMYSSVEDMAVRVPPEEAERFAGDERALELPRVKTSIRVKDEGTAAPRVVVSGALLDTNLHVNNAQYVQLAIDALEREVDAARIDVRYRVPAVLGDVICPQIHETPEGTVVELKSAEGGLYAIVRLVPRDEQ